MDKPEEGEGNNRDLADRVKRAEEEKNAEMFLPIQKERKSNTIPPSRLSHMEEALMTTEMKTIFDS